jgi:phage terminase small subunit
MPRKSASSLPLIAVDGQPSRLNPPESLTDPERTIFVDLVAACDPSHFRVSDLPLLARYVEACALGAQAAQQLRLMGAVVDGKPSPWIVVQEKCVRALVALSMRLRLSPQARLDPKTLARQQIPRAPRPWEG